MSITTPKPRLVCLWGAHGSGKTSFLNRMEKEFPTKFLPIFGDLYGNRDDKEIKYATVDEAVTNGQNVILEGKRFVDNFILDRLVHNATEANYKTFEIHLVLLTSTPEASEIRVNQRRAERGQSTDWKYQDNRGAYECKRRFYNKLESLYKSDPLRWSLVRVRIVDVTDISGWDPFIQETRDHLSQSIDFDFSRLSNTVQLSRFFNLRRKWLIENGVEIVPAEIPEATEMPVKQTVVYPTKQVNVIVDRRLSNLTDTKLPKPISKAKNVDFQPILVPGFNATQPQMSKVRRGYKKAGWDANDELISATVGGFIQLGVDPITKSSGWVSLRVTHLIPGSSTIPTPVISLPVETPVVSTSSIAAPVEIPVTVFEQDDFKFDETRPNDMAVKIHSAMQNNLPFQPVVSVGDSLTRKIQMITESFRPAQLPLLVAAPEPVLKDTFTDAMLEMTRGKTSFSLALTTAESLNPTALNKILVQVDPNNINDEPQLLEELHPDEEVITADSDTDFDVGVPLEEVFSEIMATDTVAIDKAVQEISELKTKSTPIGVILPTPFTVQQGFIEHPNCQAAYLYTLQDLLNNAPMTRRGHKVYRSFKPYTISVADGSDWHLLLPGSLYEEPINGYVRDSIDWINGEVVWGGLSYRMDKRIQRIYPKGNGAIDWNVKNELGREGRDQIGWVRRNLIQDKASRNAIANFWHPDRDLVNHTKRKELNLTGGESYQRIPCPLSFQFTRDDGVRNNRKALQFYGMFRALDFADAAHSDFGRVGEITHWLALTSDNRSYVGRLKYDIGSLIVESHGASRFVYLNNLMLWWKDDPRCLTINDRYPSVIQDRNTSLKMQDDGELLWGQPRQKSFDYFLKLWDLFGVADYYVRKGLWWRLEDSIAAVKYTHWQDLAWTCAVFEYNLWEHTAGEIIRVFGHNKNIQRSMAYEKEIGQYPPFYFLEKIQGRYHYYAAVSLIVHLIVTRQFQRLSEMGDLPSIQRVGIFDLMVADALISQCGKRDKIAFQEACPSIWSQISTPVTTLTEG